MGQGWDPARPIQELGTLPLQLQLQHEHRVFYRLPSRIDVRFRFFDAKEHGAGPEWRDAVSKNLSAGGLLLDAVLPSLQMMGDLLSGRIPVGVSFGLNDGQEPITAMTRVAWLEGLDVTEGSCCMGLRFHEVTGASQDRILDYVIRYGDPA